MHKSLLGTGLLLMFLPVHALVDFYGYRTVTPNDESSIKYKQTLLGYSELEISQITIKPRGTYLDVTEDAWISSDVTKLDIEDMTGDYMFKGTIPVSGVATVTGMQTWRGEKLFRAKLRKSEYIVDNSFPDSSTLQQSLDSRVALLQQHTETVFEVTLTRVALGEKIHVRIRYLLKPEKEMNGIFSIPVLFHTKYGSHPEHIRMKLFADKNDQTFKFIGSKGSLLLDDTATTLIPYEEKIHLQHGEEVVSTMNLTEFTSGTYRGNYASVNTGVTDSIVSRLSKPIATVFIWRWNGTPQMTTYKDNIKTI